MFIYDYYPFGMLVPNRNYSNNSYRYGYQGSEKDDEVKGEAKSYTTQFRQLDPRIGRWLSRDPKVTAFETPYSSMNNNPILYNDIKGDTIRYVGSELFVKQYKKYIGGLKGSSNSKIAKFIEIIDNDPHDFILRENKGDFSGYTVPKASEDWGSKRLNEAPNYLSKLDINASDKEFEKAEFEDAKYRLETEQNRPKKHTQPGGDSSYIFVPLFHKYYDRTEGEMNFYTETNILGNKTNNNVHKLLVHEFFHAYRMALGLMNDSDGNRKIEEKLATQFVNILYQNNDNRIYHYSSPGVSIDVPVAKIEDFEYIFNPKK